MVAALTSLSPRLLAGRNLALRFYEESNSPAAPTLELTPRDDAGRRQADVPVTAGDSKAGGIGLAWGARPLRALGRRSDSGVKATTALAALAALTMAVAVSGCAAVGVQKNAAASANANANQVGLTRYAIGKRPMPPNLQASTLTGVPFALSGTRGDVVVLNVWASWCGPCRSESPALARVARTFSGRAVQFVGIDEQDDARLAKKFIATTGATYPSLTDTHGQLLSQLALLPQAGVPSTLVLDRHGRIADRVIGPVTGPTLTGLVTDLLKES